MQSWIAQLQALAMNKTCRSPEFLRPFHFVTLALTLKANHAGQISLPPTLAGYARRMKLWESVGLAAPPQLHREHDASGRFLPIEQLTSRDAVYECAQRIAQITKIANLEEEAHTSLDTSMAEIIDNCFSHAEIQGDLHGLACAQYWARGNRAQVAIADMGVGIRTSLEKADTEDVRTRARASNCCALATELHVTSKSSGGHAGYGLALARQLLQKNGGTLIVYSGKEWCRGDGDFWTDGNTGVNWDGTIVVVEFMTDKPLSTKAVYDSWEPVRGYEHDDFDF